MVLGIAGSYCAGKTTIAKILAEKLKAQIIEVDHLGHEALRIMTSEVVEAFGPEILDDPVIEPTIDRKKLGDIVFKQEKKLRKLEQILHPAMVDMVEKQVNEYSHKPVIINAALLFPMKLDRLCDLIFWIDAWKMNRAFRGMKRDGISYSQALARIKSQHQIKPQLFFSKVDTITVVNHRLEKSLKRIEKELVQREWIKTDLFT